MSQQTILSELIAALEENACARPEDYGWTGWLDVLQEADRAITDMAAVAGEKQREVDALLDAVEAALQGRPFEAYLRRCSERTQAKLRNALRQVSWQTIGRINSSQPNSTSAMSNK